MAMKSMEYMQYGTSYQGQRPLETVVQTGGERRDWSRTFHVDDAASFVNGLFALHQNTFEDFLSQAGRAARVGETVLYQVAQPVYLRFELKKLGPNEFQVRGAHFSTPSGVNICVGLNPVPEWALPALMPDTRTTTSTTGVPTYTTSTTGAPTYTTSTTGAPTYTTSNTGMPTYTTSTTGAPTYTTSTTGVPTYTTSTTGVPGYPGSALGTQGLTTGAQGYPTTGTTTGTWGPMPFSWENR